MTPTVTATPGSSTISTLDVANVAVAVGAAIGYPTPTGTITVTSGSYSQVPQALMQGSVNIEIGSNTLPLGVDTVNFSYSGDSYYNPASGSTSITVISPGFTIAGAPVTIFVPGATGTSQITVTPSGDFAGTVSLSAALTSSPAGAVDPPVLAISSPFCLTAEQRPPRARSPSPRPSLKAQASRRLCGRAAAGTLRRAQRLPAFWFSGFRGGVCAMCSGLWPCWSRSQPACLPAEAVAEAAVVAVAEARRILAPRPATT